MRFDVITLFPEFFNAFVNTGVTGKALRNGLVNLSLWNPRNYTKDLHRTVDDRPYGGGPGMLMLVAPLQATLQAVKSQAPNSPIAYLSPQGQVFTQKIAQNLAQRSGTIFIAGRYEGVDERLLERYVDEEWSIGDYVLTGGEIPALAIMDAVIRLLPGVLGHVASAIEDSYTDGLLDCPHYTRPEEIEGMQVPKVLLSGNHAAINEWRLQQALGRTWLRRPNLLKQRGLSPKEQRLLESFISTWTLDK
ncbi:tRNA (guanine-N1)-methyltransferase [Achromatium sp. WMS3]|nr:tRNA (guanine-N1)-methyltransferase [Achromatium sp. WMS3]